ncbi:MAG TPA: hypothetical protein VJO16_15000 [Candidatus Acidoferrum sp.]|nr:hypothetical protein [Candidatus Acidoferrum sp.]
MNIFTAVILSFLPKRYRDAFTAFEIPSAGSILGGFLESAVAFGFLIQSYNTYMNERLAATPLLLMEKAAEKGGESAVASMGGFALIDFCFRITTILFAFFLLEGLVRVIAAIASRETVPSLPLKLLEYAHSQLSAEQKERSMGARLRDDVVIDPSGQSLRIFSCRPKQWTQLTTISHEGQFYELVTEQKGPAPRRFVYVLRKKPPTAVIRGIYAYSPDEALTHEQ